MSRMIRLFAATGHHSYARSGCIYLQLTLEMPKRYHWLYQQFLEKGVQSVRLSDRPWAGLWTDLAIEQLLMRALNSRGGLTRGMLFIECVRMTCVYTMNRCAGVHQGMCNHTGLHHQTSEQHVAFSCLARHATSAENNCLV